MTPQTEEIKLPEPIPPATGPAFCGETAMRHDDTERDRFKFGLLSPLDFERLSDCRSRG
jgi:hypothetical protein